MFYKIEVQNYSESRHFEISQQLRDMGFTVINNFYKQCSWIVSNEPRDRLMLPLKLDGCEVLVYDDLQAALGSTGYKELDDRDLLKFSRSSAASNK